MSICKHTEFCGGCSMQGISYEQQLAIKEDQVQKLLQEKNIHPREYREIQGSPAELGYRNKMEYTFGDMVKDGEMTLGMHQKGRFMSIVTVDQCQLVDPDFNRILASVLEFCGQKGYVHYNKKSHLGFLRNLIIRKGVRTGELLVNLVTSSQEVLDESAFVSMLESLPLDNKIVGILHTINDGMADFVYCDQLKILSGRDYYEDEILGLRFRVSAFSFFQTNVDAVERLYREALELLEDPEGKTIYDLYCGTGTISQALAIRAGRVIGVELVEEAVAAARINAELNGLKNCDFIAGDVLKVLDQVEVKPDVIVVDPPRMGIHPKAMDKILQYGVPQILYISCNPKTLSENLQHVAFYGYEVSIWKTYDNFPYTKHIETVTLLTRKG